jgi:hypothetical protein
LLASEYSFYGQHDDADKIYWDLHYQTPNEPMPLISLAEKRLYYQDNPSDAMQIIDRAIPIAMESRHFRRLALGVKARVALALRAYDIVEDVLKQLMSLKFTRQNADCGIERDFLDRLPPGVIDEQIFQDYDTYSGRARKPK